MTIIGSIDEGLKIIFDSSTRMFVPVVKSGTKQALTKSAKPLSSMARPVTLVSDVFQRSTNNSPQKITILKTPYGWRQFFDDFVQKHVHATEKYSLYPKKLPKKEVSAAHFDIIWGIQRECPNYCKLNRKAHIGEILNPEDIEYYNKVISFMDKLPENQSVLRYVEPYEGIQTEIQNGVLHFRGLTSCSTDSDFALRWGKTSCREKEVGSKIERTLPPLLKINLMSGQKVLNCNVTSNGKEAFLDSEVILPKGKGIIKK